MLEFAEGKVPKDDGTFIKYLENIRERVREYKCGEIQTKLKGFICGYFRTKNYKPTKSGTKLPYLGEVREERYIVPVSELKWRRRDWRSFIKNTMPYQCRPRYRALWA